MKEAVTTNGNLGAGETATDEKDRKPSLGWTLLHLRRSAHQFSRGLRKRLCVLSDEFIAAPLEEASWKFAEKVESVGQRIFRELDRKIDQLTSVKQKRVDDEVELGRFDGEGGAMIATKIPKRASTKAAGKPSSTPVAGTDAGFQEAAATHH